MKTIILDFGSHETKYLNCNIEGQKLHVEDFSVTTTQPEQMRGLGLPEPAAWAQATIHLNELEWIKPEEDSIVLASLPSAYLESRYLKFPFRAEKKIEKVLQFELESTIPFDIEEIQIRHRVLEGEGVQGVAKKETLVLTMAYKRDLIKNLELELRKFQLSIPPLTSEILALSTLRQFIANEPPVYGLLQFGHSKSQFLVMQKGGGVLGLRTFWWGGRQLAQALMRDSFNDPVAAVKQLERMDPTQPMTDNLENAYREFGTELRQTLKGWMTHGLTLPKPFPVFAVGAPTRAPGLLATIETALRNEFELQFRLFPLETLRSRQLTGLEKLNTHALEKALPAMAIALAQTRNHRNRIPIFSETSFQFQRNLRRLKTSSFGLLRRAAVLLIAPLIYSMIHFYVQYRENGVVISKLNDVLRTASFTPKKNEPTDSLVQRMKAQAADNRRKISQLGEDAGSPLEILTEISQLIPSSLRIDVKDFIVSTASVNMTTYVADATTAEQVISRMKQKYPTLKAGQLGECKAQDSKDKEKKPCKSFTMEFERGPRG